MCGAADLKLKTTCFHAAASWRPLLQPEPRLRCVSERHGSLSATGTNHFFDVERVGGQRSEALILISLVEPPVTVSSDDHRTLSVLIRRNVRVRLRGDNRKRFRPHGRFRPPYTREVEPIATSQRDPIRSTGTPQVELGGRNEAAMSREGAPLGSNVPERLLV